MRSSSCERVRTATSSADFEHTYVLGHGRPYGAIDWGKDDALELDPMARYTDLTGKSFEDLHPKPWPDLVR